MLKETSIASRVSKIEFFSYIYVLTNIHQVRYQLTFNLLICYFGLEIMRAHLSKVQV